MIAIKLAWRNLIGAGLRTWLNVFVLSLSFVVIIWHRGLLDGWDNQARTDTIRWQIGQGQFWQESYDPFDFFTISDAHTKIPTAMQNKPEKAVPILVSQATIYPEGRMQSALLKGIPVDQKLLALPTALMDSSAAEIPAIIGRHMAQSNRLKKGDVLTVRWRDANGTFDATEVTIAGIFKADVPAIDGGQIWIPLSRLQAMKSLPGEATVISVSGDLANQQFEGWQFKTKDVLLEDIDRMIAQKKIGGSIFYIILLALAGLAIFDTQILSIFRRQKEIGTHIAMGMTRGQVISLFTIEGTMHGILAALVGAVYGVPLLIYQATNGISFPTSGDDYGVAMAEVIYPAYSLGLIVGTAAFVLIVTAIISFLPTRRIAKLNPTEALRGKVQ